MRSESLAVLEPADPIPAMPETADPAVEHLRRWRQGDDQAFAALVREHQEAVFACAWRILNDRDAAADAVQEAFLRVVRHADRYDGRPFRPWVMEITRNLAIDALRARRCAADVSQLPLTAPEIKHIDHDLRANVAEILATLPDKYRIPLIMRELEGMAAEAVAAALGVGYDLTRWRLHEARRRFRVAWLARFGEEY